MAPVEVRDFRQSDGVAVVALWRACDLVRAWNNPHRDIDRKLAVDDAMFLVATIKNRVVGTVMAGYDGHRGWINYLAVDPDQRGQGIGALLMNEAERRLHEIGCAKINLQIRTSNSSASAFYRRLGYENDEVISMGERLIEDSVRGAIPAHHRQRDELVLASLSERSDFATDARRLVEQYVRLPHAWARHGGGPDELPDFFRREIDGLPGSLAPPAGDIVIASLDGIGIAVGCISPLDVGRCEFTRVYVSDRHRRRRAACRRAFSSVSVDVMPGRSHALDFWRNHGFVDCAPYRNDGFDMVFLSRPLTAAAP